MKMLIMLLALVSTGLGATCVYLYQQVETERDNTRVEVSRVKSLQEELQLVQQRPQNTYVPPPPVEQSFEPEAPAQTAPKAAAPVRSAMNTNNGGRQRGGRDFRENMRNNPEMQQMMRQGQRRMTERMYGAFFKKAGLSAEQSAQFSQLLADQQTRNMENMRGNFGDPQAMRAAMEQNKQANEAEVLALLGSEKYVQYENYQKTIQERMQVSMMSDRLSAMNTPLKDDQQDKLVSIMSEEKSRVAQPVDSDGNPLRGNTPERQEWNKDYNKRVLDRASQVLTAEQLKQFEQMQSFQGGMRIRGWGGQGGAGGQSVTVITAPSP